MKSVEIRRKFLEFFEGKEHKIVASAPMVVKDDPTLMFINAGMNQFKDLFLGNAEVKFPRIADTQKCLRVSGKHNDLEEVGVDTYHHTMFEMLGNWSFGDYFKKEAIDWAWELLVDVYGIDKNNLYVTIFEGADDDGLERDTEAYDFWKKHISEDRILNGSKKDNFWEMGASGPCGLCSEVHIDLRSDEEKAKISGDKLVNEDHPQVIEIWNLVFIQFNRKASGDLETLPAQHVDTGMGFERLAVVLQNKQSNYDTDVFTPLIEKVEALSSIKYGEKEETDIAIRVIVDHVRAVSFAIADGQMPSNTGAGYVIRRILRRAVRYGFSKLNLSQPFVYQLVEVLSSQLGEFFPELNAQKTLITNVIKEEEGNFLRTLDKGIQRYNNYRDVLNGKTIDGVFAFELFDTFGFPIDLTELLAKEDGLTVDMAGFKSELQKQKERSRAATSLETDDWVVVNQGEGQFVGYDEAQTEAKILRYRKVSSKGKDQFQVELDKTSFYAEGGGQVGDKGLLIDGDKKYSVVDCKKENGVFLHFLDKLPEDINASFTTVVNSNKRTNTEANHSATHLMHHALREVLGTHVEQKGSLVNEKYLRFDFSHFQKLTDEELQKVTDLVNANIRANHSLIEDRNSTIEEAKSKGAMALFGEKYGDKVRVIQFGDSIELCGGTHVKSTAQIGKFIILSESAIAAGVRRIEAITGEKADQYISDQLAILALVKETLKNPKDVVKSIEQLQQENQVLSSEIEVLLKSKAKEIKSQLLSEVSEINGVQFLSSKIDLDSADAIKNLAFELKGEIPNLFMVLGAEVKGKANLTVVVDETLSKEKDLQAGKIVRELAKEIQGGGGGQAFYATAGGKNVSGIEAALEKAKSFI